MDEAKKETIPNWAKVIFIGGIAIFSFLLSNYIFVETTSDIREFLEDQNFPYTSLEIITILAFLFTFYFIAGVLLVILKRLFPTKIGNSKKLYFILSIILSALFFILILWVIFPSLTTGIQEQERNGLWRIVFLWLLSIWALNCLINNALFEDFFVKQIEYTGCHKTIDRLCDRLFNKFR